MYALRCAFFVLVFFSVFNTHAEDWTRFRGPNGTGVSNDKEVPSILTEKNLLWKLDIPGSGASSPVVSQGKIIFQSSAPDQSKRFLIAVSLDGKLLWKKEVPGGKAKFHQLNSPASSTPAVDGKRIYTVFWDGKDQELIAFDYDGKILWKHPLGTLISDHGAGASPVVYGDMVYINNDQGDRPHPGPSKIQAFDAATGDLKWEVARKGFRISYSTPLIIEKSKGNPELIVCSTAGMTSYVPKTGIVNWNWVWKFAADPLRTVGSPQYLPGILIGAAGDGGGARSMVALSLSGSKVNEQPTILWKKDKGTPYVPTALISGENLFWVTDKKIAAVCANAKTGEILWKEDLGTGNVSASPILVDGKIYAFTEAGNLYVFKAGTKFELVSKYNLNETVIATPAVIDGKLIVRGAKHLFCFGK